MEKQVLDVSNIAGFDHENQIVDEKQKIKKEIKLEVKIEPIDENVDEGSKNDKIDLVDENVHKGSKNAKDSKRLKMMEKQVLYVSNIAGFDHENQIVGEEQKIKKEIKHEVKIEPVDENVNEEEDYIILTNISELVQKKKN